MKKESDGLTASAQLRVRKRLDPLPEPQKTPSQPARSEPERIIPATAPTRHVPAGIRWRVFPLAVLYALAAAAILLRLWHPHQAFQDVIAGPIAYQDAAKIRDFVALGLILVLATLIYYGALHLARLVLDRTRGEWKWINPLLDVPLVLCAYWLGAQLVGYDATPPVEVLLAASLLVAALPALLRFRPLSLRLIQKTGLWLLVDLLLLVGGGLGVGFLLAREFPSLQLLRVAAGYGAIGCVFLLVVIWRSSSLDRCLKTLTTAAYVLQVPLPFLFFGVLPRDTLFHDQRIAAPAARLLTWILVVVSVVAWSRLLRRYRRGDPLHAWRFRTHLEPLCLVAMAICLAVPAAFPTVSEDDFHFGEQFLPWQQLIQFGQRPYTDVIPIHGVMPFLTGGMNTLFFDGTAGSFGYATVLLGCIAVALAFLCLYRVGGLAPALFFCLSVNHLNRFYFFGPVLLYLLQPRRFRSPNFWVGVIVLALFSVAYNIPAGIALIVGLLPVVAQEGYRAWKGGLAKVRPLLIGMAVALIAMASIPAVRDTIVGFVRFGVEAGSTNDTAHAIAWNGVAAVGSPSPDALVSPLLFTVLKFGWAPMALLAFALLAGKSMQSLRRLWSARYRLLWGVPVSLIAMAPWTTGRIDPGLSRSGMFSAYCAAVFLPLLAFRYGGLSRLRGLPRSALLLGIAAVLGFYAALSGGASNIRHAVERLTVVPKVPADLLLVNGPAFNLPNLGRLYLSRTRLDEIANFNRDVTGFVGADGSYFDLTNRQALYSFTGRKEPAVYATSYIAASHQQQQRVLQQLAAHPQKLVYVAPNINLDGGLASLRSYLLYRYAVLNHSPCKIDDNVFLVAPSFPRSRCDDEPDQQVLDDVFAQWDLASLPSAWGSSWPSLDPLFDPLNVPLTRARMTLQGLGWDGKVFTQTRFPDEDYLALYPDIADAMEQGQFNSGYEHYRRYGQYEDRFYPELPGLWIDLEDLNVNPRQYDFLTFVVVGDSTDLAKAKIELRWTSDLGDVTQPVTLSVDRDRVLIPVGSYPEWLTAHHIDSVRVGIWKPEGWKSFRISGFKLLHYRPGS